MSTVTKTRTTTEVANRLLELCRKGQFKEAQEELFAENVISTEPAYSPLPSATGKTAVLQKGANFAAMIETHHSSSFSEPNVGGSYFSFAMMLDATFKGKGRMKLEEICLFQVSNGQIVSEQFFF